MMAVEDFRLRAIRRGATPAVWVDTAPRERPRPPSGWSCPEHGSEDVVVLRSRPLNGGKAVRVYGMCLVDGCEEFES